MQVSAFIAASLDGYIARKDGSLDWLNEASRKHPEEDYGYKAFADSVDCLIMGRNTLETVLGFDVEWPYESMQVIILSNTLKSLPTHIENKAEIYKGDIKDLILKLGVEGKERLYIDGGQTIQTVINAGLLTDITITTVPILLGDGISLFGPHSEDIKLTLLSSRAYPNSFVQSTYLL